MDTEKPALPPLGIDDIAAYGPDRDNERVFEPNETWCAACDAMQRGHAAATVADVLMELDDDELGALADHWQAHTLTTLDQPAINGRDFLCPDLRLALALQEADPAHDDQWSCAPTLDPESLWETVVEFDRLKAQHAALLAALNAAAGYLGDDATDDSPEAKATRAVVLAAIAEAEGTR